MPSNMALKYAQQEIEDIISRDFKRRRGGQVLSDCGACLLSFMHLREMRQLTIIRPDLQRASVLAVAGRPTLKREIVNFLRLQHGQKLRDRGLAAYFRDISQVKQCFNDHEIEKDIERTFPTPVDSRISGTMFRVLRAAAYHLPQVGYVQGFNFIVGALAQVASQELAFWVFVGLLERTHGMYTEGMQGLKLLSY